MDETMRLYGPASRYVIYGTGTHGYARRSLYQAPPDSEGWVLSTHPYSSACSNLLRHMLRLRSAGHVSDVLIQADYHVGHNTAETILVISKLLLDASKELC